MLDRAIPNGVACPTQIFVLGDTDTGDGDLEEAVPYAYFDEEDLYEKREKPDLIRLREKIGEGPNRPFVDDLGLIHTPHSRGFVMGLTIHWSFQGPQKKSEATAIIEKMRQRAMDLPFESVGEIVHFKGEQAQFDHDPPNGEYTWLKIQARETIWSQDGRIGWDCPAQEIVGFQIDVAPGSEWMEVFLATYPKTIQIEDERTRRPKRLRTNLAACSGRGFCKTQYASDARCGGVPNFLRAHLSVCRSVGPRQGTGHLEGGFRRRATSLRSGDIPALVNDDCRLECIHRRWGRGLR